MFILFCITVYIYKERERDFNIPIWVYCRARKKQRSYAEFLPTESRRDKPFVAGRRYVRT